MPKLLDAKNAEYELKQDEFYYGIDFEAKKSLLDDIIQEELNRYYIMELGYKNPEDVYLNAEEQTNLMKKITERVFTNRMTPAVISNLSFYYRLNDDRDLLALITSKVSLAVLGLTLKTNSTTIQL